MKLKKRIFFFKVNIWWYAKFFVFLHPELASRVAQCPPTGLGASLVEEPVQRTESLAAVVKRCE